MTSPDEIKENLHRILEGMEKREPKYVISDVIDEVIKLADLISIAPKRVRNALTPHAIKVLDFLKSYPGLAFQVSALSANIEEITTEQASSAVISLYTRSLIKRKTGRKASNASVGSYSYYFEQELNNSTGS